MARKYAKVSPRLWTGTLGESFRGEPAAQIVGFYLLTCPHANMIGLYRLPLAYVAEDTGLELMEVSAAMSRLEEVGFIRYDSSTRRVWVIEHARHELDLDAGGLKPTDKRVPAIERELREHAPSALVNDFLARYGKALSIPLEAPSEGHADYEEAPSKPGTGTGTGTGTEAGAGAGGGSAEGGGAAGPDLAPSWLEDLTPQQRRDLERQCRAKGVELESVALACTEWWAPRDLAAADKARKKGHEPPRQLWYSRMCNRLKIERAPPASDDEAPYHRQKLTGSLG